MRWLSIFFLLSLTLVVSAQGAPFAQGLVDNTIPYLGQPIIYTLRIYTVGETTNSSVIEPSFAGFGRASLTLDANVSSEVIGTTLYQVVEQPYILYPLNTGTMAIEPFTIDLPETPFQNGMTIFSEPLSIEVQALPENPPMSYKNAVGQFEIEVSTSTRELTSGDTFVLSMIISGSGNLEQIVSPNVTLPEGWALFDNDSVVEQDNLNFGRKIFEWTVIPTGEGFYEIPSIEFAFFNPQAQQYETRRTASTAMTLLPNGSLSTLIIPTREPVTTNDTPPILKSTTIGLAAYPPLWFWILWLIAPVILFFMWIPTKLKAQPQRRRRRVQKGSRAIREFKKTLKQAQANEPKVAYLSVETAIYDYLSAKLGENITFDNVEGFITELPLPVQEQIMVCIEETHQGQYAPVGKADVIALLKQCLRVFTDVEEELK